MSYLDTLPDIVKTVGFYSPTTQEKNKAFLLFGDLNARSTLVRCLRASFREKVHQFEPDRWKILEHQLGSDPLIDRPMLIVNGPYEGVCKELHSLYGQGGFLIDYRYQPPTFIKLPDIYRQYWFLPIPGANATGKRLRMKKRGYLMIDTPFLKRVVPPPGVISFGNEFVDRLTLGPVPEELTFSQIYEQFKKMIDGLASELEPKPKLEPKSEWFDPDTTVIDV